MIKNMLQTHHPIRHANSFRFAFKGLFHALVNEANFRVQVVLTALLAFLGYKFQISNLEWAVLIITSGFLLSAEMVNTVVEEFIDHLIKEQHEGARIIKDLSAGFVLTAAITTMLIATLIFAPRFVELISL